LTAVVKLFLKRPKETQELVQKVLNLATQETDNPDLRDRGYVYWRLLSTDPEAAKTVVLGEKPLISDSTIRLDETLLDELISQISTLASVYHKPPEAFVSKLRDLKREKKSKPLSMSSEEIESPKVSSHSSHQPNLLDLDDPTPQSPTTQRSNNLFDEDFFGQPVQSSSVQKEVVLTADKAQGYQISAAYSSRNGVATVDFTFFNHSSSPLSQFALQFNKNSFSLSPSQPTLASVMPGQSADTSIQLTVNPAMAAPGPITNQIQVAVKNNVGVYYFTLTVPVHLVFNKIAPPSKDQYISTWKAIAEEHLRDINVNVLDATIAQKKLEANNYIYMANRKVQQQDFLYFTASLNNVQVLLELQISPSGVKSCVKTQSTELVPLVEHSVAYALSH